MSVSSSSLYGFNRHSIIAALAPLVGKEEYRIKQITQLLFDHRKPLEKWNNIPNLLKERILACYPATVLPEIVERAASTGDGADKLLLRNSPHGGSSDRDKRARLYPYECVILKYSKQSPQVRDYIAKERVTLCVSCQVGCKRACTFCQTGKLGFIRDLDAHEIIGQFLVASQMHRIDNLVFMGQGEPLDNSANVIQAANTLINDYKIGRVTISTVGHAPEIVAMAKERKCVGAQLAVSLHAANDTLRSELMPTNRLYPLQQLKDALIVYQKELERPIITIEYLLIRGKNDSIVHAGQLVSYLHGIRCKVNLIPFNSHPGIDFARPADAAIREFQQYLHSKGFVATVRRSLGSEASAACGQLAGKPAATADAIPSRKLLRLINK